MSNLELRSAIEWLKYRYRYYSKKRKGEVLDELVERFSVDRKYLVRLLAPQRGDRPKTPSKGGRPSRYGDKPFQTALKTMWKVTKYMCGKYLEEAMPEWLEAYEVEYQPFPADIHERLLSISGASIDRYLMPFKAEHGLTLTRPGGVLRSEIPIQGNIWDEQRPGFLERDTSAHCGSTTFGEFVSSLTTVETPYARLLASPFVTEEAKERLKAQHAALNPIRLSQQETASRKAIDQLNKKLKQRRYDTVSKKEVFQIKNHESFSVPHNLGDMGFEA